jgi:hypothetical protein
LEIDLAGKLAAVYTDGLGLPLALDNMRVFLRVSEEKIPLLPEGILVPAGLMFGEFLTVRTEHDSIVTRSRE